MKILLVFAVSEERLVKDFMLLPEPKPKFTAVGSNCVEGWVDFSTGARNLLPPPKTGLLPKDGVLFMLLKLLLEEKAAALSGLKTVVGVVTVFYASGAGFWAVSGAGVAEGGGGTVAFAWLAAGRVVPGMIPGFVAPVVFPAADLVGRGVAKGPGAGLVVEAGLSSATVF
jgi:hypothetical protein